MYNTSVADSIYVILLKLRLLSSVSLTSVKKIQFQQDKADTIPFFQREYFLLLMAIVGTPKMFEDIYKENFFNFSAEFIILDCALKLIGILCLYLCHHCSTN